MNEIDKFLQMKNIDAAIDATLKKSAWEIELDRLNEKYAVVQDGTRIRVHSFEAHKHQGHTRLVSTFLHFAEFQNLLMHRTVKYKGEKIELGYFWLHHPKRRQYSGIVFKPNDGEEVDSKLNLWRGFGIAPAQGDWSLMQRHMFEVMASSNGEHFEYIMNWLAWAVQHPDQRAEVALVFRGKRGTGKGTLGNALCRLFGQHAVHISSADHLTGRFNHHLRDACFLFADESYWPGDKSAEGSLKRLITEPTLFIEGKGRDGIQVPNMLHVLIASNESWVVPAGERERRWVMLEVSDSHIQDAAWFEPLYAQLEAGGYAAMLYDLLHHDLGDWHPRQLPKDTGLIEQQQRSLAPLDAWWIELVESGQLWGCDPMHPERAVSNTYDKEVDIGEKYPRFVKQPGLFEQARALVPQLRSHTTDHELGGHLRMQGCDNKKKVMRRQGWWFPPLLDCRAAWMERFPDWQWRNDLKEWQSEEGDEAPETLAELEQHAEELEKKASDAKVAIAAHLRYERTRRADPRGRKV